MLASGAEVEQTELDDLLLDIHEQQQQVEVQAAEASEAITRNLKNKERKQKKFDGY